MPGRSARRRRIYVNARTLGQRRVAALSLDGGETFAKIFEIGGLEEPFESRSASGKLYMCVHTEARTPLSIALIGWKEMPLSVLTCMLRL